MLIVFKFFFLVERKEALVGSAKYEQQHALLLEAKGEIFDVYNGELVSTAIKRGRNCNSLFLLRQFSAVGHALLKKILEVGLLNFSVGQVLSAHILFLFLTLDDLAGLVKAIDVAIE